MPNNGSKDSHKNDYLSTMMQEAMRSAGIHDVGLLAEWQEKAQSLDPDAFVHEAKSLKGVDISPLEDYISASKSEVMVRQTPKKTKASNAIIDAMHQSLGAASTKEKLGHLVMKIDLPISNEQMKHAVKEVLNSINPHTEVAIEDIILPFFISRERALQGRVLSNLDGMKKSVTLIQAYRDNGVFKYQFFGEARPVDKKTVKPCATFSALFWVYKFITDDNEEYVLISPQELELENSTICGMEANLYDFLKIGNLARLSTTTKVVFVHSQEPAVGTLNETAFWGTATRIDTPEKCYKAFFGSYPHPQWFAEFITSWLFSGKLDNMPTHLSILSDPSLGKTKMAENIGTVFGQQMLDGGTLKSLVPSFANGIPNEGYLIKCKRIALVDEFVNLLSHAVRAGSSDTIDGGSALMLKVLEHSTGDHSSAFGTIKAKPRMWAMFVSNIKSHEHMRNLIDLHAKLNVAFMSRLLWYTYDEEHKAFINREKDRIMKFSDDMNPVYSEEMCALVDYLHKVTLDIPEKEVRAILEKYRPLVPADLMTDIYDSRMVMHIYRIADGYAKYKSITERRGELVCTPQDLKDVDAMFGRIIRSWSIGVDESRLPPAVRVTYLNSAQRSVFEYVKTNEGVDEYTLVKAVGATSSEIIQELVKKGLIKLVPTVGGVNSFYTYNAV